jgi:hypothetical protein
VYLFPNAFLKIDDSYFLCTKYLSLLCNKHFRLKATQQKSNSFETDIDAQSWGGRPMIFKEKLLANSEKSLKILPTHMFSNFSLVNLCSIIYKCLPFQQCRLTLYVLPLWSSKTVLLKFHVASETDFSNKKFQRIQSGTGSPIRMQPSGLEWKWSIVPKTTQENCVFHAIASHLSSSI